MLTSQSGFVFGDGSDGKVSVYKMGDTGLIPGSGRSPGEANGNPLQYSCLETSMDRGAWQATAHGITKSRTQLSKMNSENKITTSFLKKLFFSFN